MINLLTKLHNKAQNLSGGDLITAFIVVFLVFLGLGITINNYTNKLLNKNEISDLNIEKDSNQNSYNGVITFVDPNFYPEDDISFYLADQKGKEIMLLKASDQKLEVSEGLNAQLYGTIRKTEDQKKDVLFVEKIVIKN